MRRGVFVLPVLSLLLLLPGCGGSSSSNTGQLRFVQGSPDAPLMNLQIDGHLQSSNIGYGNVVSYISLSSGSHHVQLIPVNGTSPLLDQSVSLATNQDVTLYLTGPASQLKPLQLTDGGTTASSGNGYMRVLIISSTVGPADVYIVNAGSGLAGATPIAKSVPFDQQTSYQLLVAGDYDVFLTAPGTVNAFLSTGPLHIASGDNQTILIRDASTGGLTFSQLKDQNTTQ